MEYKIPAFLSELHHGAASPEQKRLLLQRYNEWLLNDITKSYILHLEKQLLVITKEDEEKTDWLSVFHWKYKQAHAKGQRSLLRKLLKQLKP
jgi:hypothetical protein